MTSRTGVLVTSDSGLASYALAHRARLDSLNEIRPNRFEFALSDCPVNVEADFLNNAPVGVRDFLAAQQTIKTALAGASRRAGR